MLKAYLRKKLRNMLITLSPLSPMIRWSNGVGKYEEIHKRLIYNCLW